MSIKKWKQILDLQMKKYYVKPFKYSAAKPPVKNPFEESKNDEQVRMLKYKEKLR